MTHALLFDNCIGTIIVLSLLLSAGFTALYRLGTFWAGASISDVKQEVIEFCCCSFGGTIIVLLFLLPWGAVLENRLIGDLQEEPVRIVGRIGYWLLAMSGLAVYISAPLWGYRTERKAQKKKAQEEEMRQLNTRIDKIIEGARGEVEPYPGTNWYVYLWTSDGQEHRVCTSTDELKRFVQQHPDASASKPENVSPILSP